MFNIKIIADTKHIRILKYTGINYIGNKTKFYVILDKRFNEGFNKAYSLESAFTFARRLLSK